MQKYEKNKNIKPDSLMQTLISVISMGLMILGIVGVTFEFFRTNGVLSRFVSKIFDSSYTLILIPVLLLGFYFADRWMVSRKDQNATKRGNILLYAMMVVGVFFLFRLLTTGSLNAD